MVALTMTMTRLMAPRIGKFEISRRLGRGGMGAVYEGYDRSLARRVAVKTLTAELISDLDSRRRFEREAQAAAKLQHPNIITIYELGNFGREGSKPYIVMEYLEGFDLSTLIAESPPIPLIAALKIAIELCRALDFAHQHDIVHRDVKPSNVRYLFDGRIKIMDFGIARMDGAAPITRSGVMVGTPHYMSPEQIRGTKIDGRSDVFSAGCILYEMLAGVRPFQGDSTTAVLFKIVNESPPPILESRPDIPDPVEHILTRALAKEADDRFRTAREMADELERLEIVYQRTIPRPSAHIEKRLTELENLRRTGRWAEVLSLAEGIAGARPDLETPWHACHQATLAMGKKDSTERTTPGEEARHLSEISREISALSLDGTPEVATVGRAIDSLMAEAEAPEVKEIPAEAPELPELPEHRAGTGLWIAGAFAALAMAVLLWFVGSLFVSDKGARVASVQEADPISSANDQDRVDAGKPAQIKEPEEPPEELDLRPTPIVTDSSKKVPEEDALPESAEAQTESDGTAAIAEPNPFPPSPSQAEESASPPEVPTTTAAPADRSAESADEASEFVAPKILGTLRIRSRYPLSVLRGEEALSEAASDVSVDLEVGRQEIVLFAPDVFLNQKVAIDIQEGQTTYHYAPELGRASIRAFPENGILTIDGLEAKALPLTDMPIVEGSHAFTFRWPSGRSEEQTVVVQKGKRVYVTGQYR